MSTATPTYFFHVRNSNFKQPIWFLVSVTVILQKVHCSVRPETDFHIFVLGWINIWGEGVLLLALAGAWLQRPERPRKKFNKICFLGLHGEI
jgi:hypothetical protein